MRIKPLGVPDAWVCTPRQFPDERGAFLEWFRPDLLAGTIGRRIEMVQGNHSVSRRGVVRGLHYADVPPGQAKYVYCSRGAVLDVVVDLRAGSPTFGHRATLQLDDVHRRAVFISEGLAHAFCVLSDSADVTYLVSTTYDPSAEKAIDPLDPGLDLPWPFEPADLLLSDKDAEAPSLADAVERGLLPSYDACVSRYAALT